VADIATGTRGKMRSLPSLCLSLSCLTPQTGCLSSDRNEESRQVVLHRKGYSSETWSIDSEHLTIRPNVFSFFKANVCCMPCHQSEKTCVL